jgi:hypothetical protein
VYGSGSSAEKAPGRDASRNQRYSYLVGRLHNRQITMEEATELFTLMQSMIQTSESARAALMRVPPPPSPIGPTAAVPAPAAPAPAAGDDLLLVGLLAMGAGAGLLAAMTKRIQEATPPAAPASNSGSNPVTGTRKG